jgi:gliding motility-associated-like protein
MDHFSLKNTVLYLLLLLAPFWAFGGDAHHGELKFEENRGQLPAHVHFRARIPGGSVFLEGQTLTFDISNLSEIEAISAFKHGERDALPDVLHGHVFKVHLVNSQAPSTVSTEDAFDDYVNYFLGDDPTKWAGGVQQFASITFRDVYPGIDVRYYSLNHQFKYDFIVHPGADPSQIELAYEGVDDLKLAFGNVLISTSAEEILDQHPVSWIVRGSEQVFVASAFKAMPQSAGFPHIGFEIARNDSATTVIDPTLIFSTYTGSTINNWGSTATYDSLGNMYAGGYMLATGSGSGSGYPTSTGAYQTSFAGGTGSFKTDMTITKFNASGNALVYSTYLGGNGNEIPHSLVVNGNNQLYVLGTTSSNNYPVTSGAFDASFNGGAAIGASGPNSNSSQIQYTNGSDIVITKFNTGGTNLIGSTYIGGTSNDGINMSDTLQKAYSDEFRGEIIVDQNDNCYVATSTASSDFPIVNGFQSTFGGGLTDGVVFKFNSNLSSLIWSSFIGGSSADAAYSVQFDPSYNVFCTGGTKSSNFPTTSGTIHTTYQGGVADGWLAKVSNNGQTLLASTFLGTNAYDQSFFVQLDLAGFVYVVGQTLGNYPIGPSWVYSVANSGQFLHKLSNNLQSTVFSTRWGSGNNNINLSLTAFLVNECNHIFVSGWGGSLFGIGTATSSGGTTTNGLTTTSNAYKPTTDGHDFYFIVFEDSATSILFASFYGGNTGASGGEHTDGGTSRFDKKGIIYQSACASCGQASSFPTTTGAYATTKPSGASCNLAALKYDLITLIAEADVDGPLEVCINDSIQFENASFGGSEFEWDFGDGNTSSAYEPKHAYSTAGTYDVFLIIRDSVSCVYSDTDSIQITVNPGPIASVPSFPKVCPGDPIQLSASGGTSYHWAPASGLSNPNIANPIATIDDTKTYVVSVTDSCGTDTAHVTLKTFPDRTDAITDTSICRGLSGSLWASGGLSYSWSPPLYLTGTNSATPTMKPDSTTQYTVTILDSFLCERQYEVDVWVYGYVPEVTAWGDTTICSGERVMLHAQGTDEYEWTPKENVLSPYLNSTPAYPVATTTYTVEVKNACGSAFDSVTITVDPVELVVSGDTAVCQGDTVYLRASGTYVYKWTGAFFQQPSYARAPSITPSSSGWYIVEGRNLHQCSKTDSVYVTVYPNPELHIEVDQDTISGLENVLLVANSNAFIRWTSAGYIPCVHCDSIKVYPKVRTVYYVEAYDLNGCVVGDSLVVKPISKVYVPNSFSPDGDGKNDVFTVKGHLLRDYSIQILDRWGSEVYRSSDMASGWNGKKHNRGKDAPIGVYTYIIRYTVVPDQQQEQVGQVLLIR